MAIEPLTAPYKTLTFDGETAASFGVQILGKGTFNAPKRDVEMIAIPGRSGDLALDKGRFENIEVKYPARLIADSTEDFADAISAFRNFLCSRKGYCRLSDDYNPDEYRMAVYSRGLEADVDVLKAGKFDIVFDCKPQRWLNTGEEAVTVASGDTLTNPTLFESSPLLRIHGYGTVNFNGYEIELVNEVMGSVILADELIRATAGASIRLKQNLMNAGDPFVLNASSFFWALGISDSSRVSQFTINSITDSETNVSTVASGNGYYTKIPPLDFIYGTPSSFVNTTTINGTYTLVSSGQTRTFTITLTTSIDYTSGGYLSFVRRTTGVPASMSMDYRSNVSTRGQVVGDSTVSILGNPTYIDCDLGEAYKRSSGDLVSLNSYVDLGSDLPTLAPGENEITFDSTITQLDIVPRWWKI